MATQLHFTEDAFALHLLLERLERLVDIVVANENLHLAAYSSRAASPRTIRGAKKRFRSGCQPAKAGRIS